MESGLPCFGRGSTSTDLLWYASRNGGHDGFAYGTITLCREPFQTLRLPLPLSLLIGARNPALAGGLGLSAFDRLY